MPKKTLPPDEHNAVLRLPSSGWFWTGKGWSAHHVDAQRFTKEQAKGLIRAARDIIKAHVSANTDPGLPGDQRMIARANVITDYGTDHEATILVA